MTPAELAFWQRFNRRASQLRPEIARALLLAIQQLRHTMPEPELVRLIERGEVDEILRRAFGDKAMQQAFAPVRESMRGGVADAVKYFSRDIPRAAGSVTFAFDILNPAVLEGIRTLETRVMTTLKENVRETVRQHVERGLQEGVGPREIARGLRSSIGLAPNQERAVYNFERALRGDADAANPLEYKLRDKRFDRSIAKGTLTEDQVEKMVTAYRRRYIAHNAETNARTAALDSMRLGQRLSIEHAIEQGVYDRDRMTKTWKGVMDDRERPEHVQMEGETVGFDERFSNGQMIPGENEFNCRCVPIYRHRKAA